MFYFMTGCSVDLEALHFVDGRNAYKGGAVSTIEAGNVAMTNVSFTGCESEGVRAASTHGHPAPTPSIHALATQKGNDGARGVILLGRPDPTLTPFCVGALFRSVALCTSLTAATSRWFTSPSARLYLVVLCT